MFYTGLNFKKIVPNIKNQAVNLQTNGVMKSQRVYLFLVVLLLIFPGKIFSQQQMPRIAQNSPHTLYFSENFQKHSFRIAPGYRNNETLSGALFERIAGDQYLIKPSVNVEPCIMIMPNYCTTQLGFFCRKELQFEKNSSIPLRLRLGSLEYVNRLEGKR